MGGKRTLLVLRESTPEPPLTAGAVSALSAIANVVGDDDDAVTAVIGDGGCVCVGFFGGACRTGLQSGRFPDQRQRRSKAGGRSRAADEYRQDDDDLGMKLFVLCWREKELCGFCRTEAEGYGMR